jgi:hypothetical protein
VISTPSRLRPLHWIAEEPLIYDDQATLLVNSAPEATQEAGITVVSSP